MPKLDLEKINSMLVEAQSHIDKYVAAPRQREYSFKVAGTDLIRKVKVMLSNFNKEVATEYRTRKANAPKREKKTKPTPSAAPATSASVGEEQAA